MCQSILLKVVLYSTQACQYNAHSNNIISYHTAIQKQHDWCQQVEQELFPFRSTCVHHWFLVGFVNKGNNKITELRTVFYVVFCRSSFGMLSFFFLPLFCLSFFDLRILFIPLLSANFSPWVTCDVWRFSLSCLARFSLFSPKDLKKSSLL